MRLYVHIRKINSLKLYIMKTVTNKGCWLQEQARVLAEKVHYYFHATVCSAGNTHKFCWPWLHPYTAAWKSIRRAYFKNDWRFTSGWPVEHFHRSCRAYFLVRLWKIFFCFRWVLCDWWWLSGSVNKVQPYILSLNSARQGWDLLIQAVLNLNFSLNSKAGLY